MSPAKREIEKQLDAQVREVCSGDVFRDQPFRKCGLRERMAGPCCCGVCVAPDLRGGCAP
jgi:hypothetical protein